MTAADGKITGLEALTHYVLYAVYEVTTGDNVGLEKLDPVDIVTAKNATLGVPAITLTLHHVGALKAAFNVHAGGAGEATTQYYYVKKADEVPETLPDAASVKGKDGEVHDDDGLVSDAEVGLDDSNGLLIAEGLTAATSYVVYSVAEADTPATAGTPDFSDVKGVLVKTLHGGDTDQPDEIDDPAITGITDVAAVADFRDQG